MIHLRKISSDIVVEYAMEIGFNLVGFTHFVASKRSSLLKDWLSWNCHGSMKYLERSLSVWENPHSFFPEGKVVISLAVNYYNSNYDELVSEIKEPFAKISRYASSIDYHLILRDMTEKLVSFIKKESGSDMQYRICVDTCPIPEKEFAFNAGVGWMGKNTCIISPSFGSWIFLSELIIDMEFGQGKPIQKNCKDCTKCIEACPTNAITNEGYLDAARCISFLTIENRGAIPIELRESMGNMLFGCDICQEVCPDNKRIETHIDAFRGGGFPVLNLEQIFSIDKKRFIEKYKGTSIIRAGRKGLLRNAAVVMGNSRNPMFLEQLSMGIVDDDPVIRSHAAWAIGKIGGGKAKDILNAALKRELNPYVRNEISHALEYIAH